MAVAGANMHWVCLLNKQPTIFVCLVRVKSQITLHLNMSPETLSIFLVPVRKLLKVVLHVKKGAKFEKVNSGQDICSRVTSVVNVKISKKHVQSQQ